MYLYNAVPCQCCMCLLYLGSPTCSTKVFAVCQDAASEYRHPNGGFGFLSPVAPVIQHHCMYTAQVVMSLSVFSAILGSIAPYTQVSALPCITLETSCNTACLPDCGYTACASCMYCTYRRKMHLTTIMNCMPYCLGYMSWYLIEYQSARRQ